MAKIEEQICESCFESIDAGVFFVAEDAIQLTLCLECFHAVSAVADV
jgi:hypothetical protein